MGPSLLRGPALLKGPALNITVTRGTIFGPKHTRTIWRPDSVRTRYRELTVLPPSGWIKRVGPWKRRTGREGGRDKGEAKVERKDGQEWERKEGGKESEEEKEKKGGSFAPTADIKSWRFICAGRSVPGAPR